MKKIAETTLLTECGLETFRFKELIVEKTPFDQDDADKIIDLFWDEEFEDGTKISIKNYIFLIDRGFIPYHNENKELCYIFTIFRK